MLAQRGKSTNELADRFLKLGLKSLEDYEIVELLLGLVLPTKESKKQARRCIEELGSLRRVVEASSEELAECGVLDPGILCIKLVSEIPVRVLKQKIRGGHVYRSSHEVFQYLSYSMRRLKKEVFKVLYLNTRNQIIEELDLFEGTIDSIPVFPRQIVESAINYNATALIFAHNHPAGDPTPSRNDKQLTRDLVFLGSILQIKVLDHIIIGDDNHFSFHSEGLIEKYEDSFLMLRMKATL
jgi:DNA repair protein RadC